MTVFTLNDKLTSMVYKESLYNSKGYNHVCLTQNSIQVSVIMVVCD